MRQMKRSQQRKAKVDEAVTTAKNAIDQTTNNVGGRDKREWSRINQSSATSGC